MCVYACDGGSIINIDGLSVIIRRGLAGVFPVARDDLRAVSFEKAKGKMKILMVSCAGIREGFNLVSRCIDKDFSFPCIGYMCIYA